MSMLLSLLLAIIVAAVMLWIIRPLIGFSGGHLTEDHLARAEGYRAALQSLETDRDGALIAPAEAGAERGVLGRALLAEAAAAAPEPAVKPLPRWAPFALAGSLPLIGLALYFATGMTEDRASFMAYSEDAKIAELGRQLALRVAKEPQDPEGHRLLGMTEAARGDYAAAAEQYAKALALGPRTPELLTAYGEVLALVAGQPTEAALAAFDEAVTAEPRFLRARINRAQSRFALGHYEAALEDLRLLQDAARPGTPFAQVLAQRIAEAESALKGQAIAGAGKETQEAMIQGMVESLAQRLEANPKDLSGWTRLIRSYVVLGEKDKARAALAKARAAFAGDAGAKPVLDQAERGLP
jgi:cytochrome c-type biogenesis protein CcmH